ncbi:leucine-rich repeat domain-containing protein [Paramaledivibacter caminithermalis]|uniref:Leucine Rich repeat-containing protein n=1 Tax=Paramaledivibacter caminithermalis (strain DSM 15212 / CIP 107654 / DViRD3) TaxID=1121301 RepID=A0A1M6KES4_PARC5|nr:leucine-rich repeat domain-containing protein [Paramaledivibacter caminithermalis]SHJ57413.1 Leucine Rich repeat-containing protein [Paramaledivibacter caminithermalis DSM 15212]
MKKAKVIIITLIMVLAATLSVNAVELPSKTDISIEKTWTIEFNMEVDESTVNTNNIYITDSKGGVVDSIVKLRKDKRSVYIIPRENYDYGETYCIHINNKVRSTSGNYLREKVEMEFTTISINHPPEVINEIEDIIVKEGEVITLDLNTIFSDPDGDSLIFGATLGDLYDNIFRYTANKDIDMDRILLVASDGEAVAKYEFNIILNKIINFGDRNIEAAVRDAIDKPGGVVYVEDVKNITELAVNKKGVCDLEGIQYLTGLKSLQLAFNNIEDISLLKNLVNLESLDLRVNSIEDISVVRKLVNLTSLELGYNKISNISYLGNLDKLVELDISYNKIEDISALSSIAGNLEILIFIGNDIKDFSPIDDYINKNN